ncbi:transposase [Nostoc sp.]|uniref:transposase n=1 Tax=Nostoc sp. TaxID=1180 RepID=UPI003593633A
MVQQKKLEVLNAIFYVLVEGVRWRCLRQPEAGTLPSDFPAWQTVYTYFRNWSQDGTWLHIHDSLREWTRIEIERHRSPSEAIIR